MPLGVSYNDMSRSFGLLCLCCAFLTVACDQTSKPSEPDGSANKASPVTGASPDKETNPPSSDNHVEQPPALTKKEIDKLDTEYQAAKADAGEKNGDPTKKAAYVKATVKLADGYMFATDVPPSEKYKKALDYYREAFKADPTQEKAKQNIDMIESIYKSMGKAIPD